MGLLRKTLLMAVAAKVVEQARKPQNQQRVKDLIESRRATARRSS